MKGRLILTSALMIMLIAVPAFSFNWPQLVTSSDDFHSFFGAPRNNIYTNSVLFRFQDAVKAADSGTVLIRLESENSDMGWFPSTLGNAVILSHQNDMLTVYGNLEKTYVEKGVTDIVEGNVIGESGSSGWQEGMSSLEFQVADTKVKTVINPLILMPQLTQQGNPVIENLTAYSDSGSWLLLKQGTKISAGVYQLYINKQKNGMTYKTTASVNGAVTETITYNMMKQDKNLLCFSGKKNYSYKEIFPDDERQFISEVILSKGKNTISITVTDAFGNSRTAVYSVDVI